MKGIFKAITIISLVTLASATTPKLQKVVTSSTDDSEYLSVNGTTLILDEEYIAQCTCQKPIQQKPGVIQDKVLVQLLEDNTCQISQVKIREDQEGDGADELVIKDLIGDASNLTLAKVVETGFKTMDGRITGNYLATPGGDAGEFILALQIFSEMNSTYEGVYLTQDDVKSILEDYLSEMKQDTFYMATDDRAVAHIQKQLDIMGLDLTSPRAAYQSDILDIITEQENIGDLHLKLLIADYQQYSVNKTLVEYFLKSYFEILWDDTSDVQDKLFLEVLAGSHNETAFVEIRTDLACLRNNRAPMIESKSGSELQVFINHVDAVTLQRAELAKYFTQSINSLYTSFDTEIMFKRMNHMGLAFLDITGASIAKYLPFYTVSFI